MERVAVLQLDKEDPLHFFRGLFHLQDDEIYLCGHSLGPLSKSVPEQVKKLLLEQWGQQKIKSWNSHWIDLPEQVSAQIARLIGADASEVMVADSTSVNLFKLLLAGLNIQQPRNIILTESDNFPTDLYIAQGIKELLPHIRLISCERQNLTEQIKYYGEEIAVIMLTHVNYRSSELFDIKEITKLAHQHGALMLFDLSHSVGIMPVNLTASGVDLAVGCCYKYLNGGPGAPSFLYAAKKHHEKLVTPLTGWMGHCEPFSFKPVYQPAPGIKRFLCGTPPILSLASLQQSLQILENVSIAVIRQKSLALSKLFIDLMASECPALQLVSPREEQGRGGHVAYLHECGYAINRALQARNIIADYRKPHLLRFSFPAYLRYVDVWDTVFNLKMIVNDGIYQDKVFQTKVMVT